MNLRIEVEHESSVPIYLQIVQQLRERIATGEVSEGTLLPPERTLAQQLGVNRSTVVSAYRELKRSGLAQARVGRGTSVLAFAGEESTAEAEGPLPWRQLFSESVRPDSDPLVRDLLEMAGREDVIPLSVGLPAPELLPLELVRRVTRDLGGKLGSASLLQCPTEGVKSFREALASRMRSRGVECGAEEVLVLSGSQQGLDLASRVFLDPGDIVVVDEPTYFGALQAFRGARARILPVPSDEQGMITDVLATVLERHRPKLIYTLPTFKNPAGTVMSLSRRQHLLDLAWKFQVPVLEDDPYSDLRYDGENLPSLKALDRHGGVIYLSTFSKILFPGLRLGWLVADRPVVRQFALLKQVVDLHSDTPGQWVVDALIREGTLDEHVKMVKGHYARRRDLMHETLQSCAPAGVRWVRPEGGFYVWCRLPLEVERSRLVSTAAEAGVSFLPGWSCYVEDPGTPFIRLNFSFAREDQIVPGVTRLMEAVARSSAGARLNVAEGVGTHPIV